jgi:DNA-binding MarR family transcriptional regulator
VTLVNVKCDVTKNITVTVIYTPDDDPKNGQPNGANPCWLNMTFEDGSYEHLHHIFNVNHPETWVWNIDFNQYLVGREITFVATATDLGNDDLTFTWNWGDGTPYDETVYYNDGLNMDPYPSPQGTYPINVTDVKKHINTLAGIYPFTVTAADDDGGAYSDTVTVQIDESSPKAFAGGPYFVNEGSPITFTGSQIESDGLSTNIYYWDFGDGKTSIQQNPTHFYSIYGSYTATFMIIRENGETALDTCCVYVNAHPVADAGLNQTVYERGTVQFDGSGSYDPDGEIAFYTWDFDSKIDEDSDGNYINDADATGSSTQHVYYMEGEYRVTLWVSDGSSVRMDFLTVTVLPLVIPKINETTEYQEMDEDEIEEDKEIFEITHKQFSDIPEQFTEIQEEIYDFINDETKKSPLPTQTEQIVNYEYYDENHIKPSLEPPEGSRDEESDFPVVTITISISSIIISTLSLSLPLYMKINPKDLLKHPTRKSIYKHISTNPGDNFNSIKDALKLSNGVLSYHLKVMERENLITSKRDGGYKRFYITGNSEINNVKRFNGIQKDIFNTIKNYPGISQTEIAEKTKTTVQVVNYHIKRLQEEGIIKLHMTNGHRSQCFLEKKNDIAFT